MTAVAPPDIVTAAVEGGEAKADAPGWILAIWLPILTFFALGYEHAVVNHFTIPAGMMLGADVSIADWLLWNQIPVHVGNFIGGITLAGLGLYFAQRTRVDRSPGAPAGHTHPPQE
ncbi:formate/nitrite transporter [Dietzia kunjamensis]|uniref:formate/nitrite transporter family protein n=1 Tax=Dietzia kunjamensis TaxID=322509 RepID=UPI000FEEC1EA|nr:formate/nitrite transporter family protein [Dietzia kunjamensis]RKE58574.1 formate/nitrite transporter [Dietzia kunjamensis]